MLTREQAIEKFNSKWWVGKTAREICDIQMYENLLCVEWSVFHKAVEECLGRPVWTHEFADKEGLVAEYEGKRPPESNPLESSDRILRKLGRDDLADNMIVVVSPNKREA